MVLFTSLLLLVMVTQNFTAYPEYQEKPKKCYTCASLVTSRDCGEKFRKLNFLARDCSPDKKYCLRLTETTGGSSFMYRKCTSNNCSEEANERYGVVVNCSICTETLCNKTSSLNLTIFLFPAVLWYHYINR